jgi:O-antigen/teichoic acid export membrane protein
MVAALAAIVPFVLLREFVRKIAFAHLDMGAATAMDAGIAVLQFAGLGGLAAAGRLSAVTGLAVVGLAWGAGGAIWLALWRDRFLVRAKRVPLALRRNWRLGRWVFASVTTFMLQSSLTLWMLALLLGTAASGLFAACINVVALSTPFVNAVLVVLTPRGARAFWQGGGAAVRLAVFRAARAAGALTGVFALVLCVAGGEILQLLFGHKFFGTDGGDPRIIIALLGFWGLARALGMTAYTGLYVIQRPSMNLWINLATLVPLPFLLPIVTASWSVLGAATALLGLELAALAARWAALVAHTRPAAETTGLDRARKTVTVKRVRQPPARAAPSGPKALPEIATRPDGTLP